MALTCFHSTWTEERQAERNDRQRGTTGREQTVLDEGDVPAGVHEGPCTRTSKSADYSVPVVGSVQDSLASSSIPPRSPAIRGSSPGHWSLPWAQHHHTRTHTQSLITVVSMLIRTGTSRVEENLQKRLLGRKL